VLTRMEAARMVAELRRVYFPERTRELTLSVAREVAGPDRARALGNLFAREEHNVKGLDARRLLRRMRRDLGRRVEAPSRENRGGTQGASATFARAELSSLARCGSSGPARTRHRR
jgi:hypothetical protein